MIRKWVLAMLSLIAVTGPAAAADEWQADAETGLAFLDRGDVRIPGDAGTRFSLTGDLDTDPNAFWRLRISWLPADRHTISFLVAPLRFESIGSFAGPVSFNGQTFPADSTLTARYRFDSYRLTYRYRLVKTPSAQFGLGFTAKIRDAEVSIEQGIEKSEKTNTGFVPLINFAFDWKPTRLLTFRLAGDALAAPQGRAEDVLAAVLYQVMPRVQLKAGYRILEGGVDNDEVYNFTVIHYAVLGVVLTK